MSSIKGLNFEFLQSKIIHKNKFIDRIVNNMKKKKKTFDFIDMKFDLFFKNINNI